MSFKQPQTLVLLGTQTASSSATISLTSLISSTYSSYVIKVRNMNPQTNNTQLKMLFSINNGSTYLNANYMWTQGYSTASVTGTNGSNSDTTFQIQDALNNTAILAPNFNFQFFNLNSASNVPYYISEGSTVDSSGSVLSRLWGSGAFSSVQQTNAIRFQMSSGNIVSGNFYMYGVVEP